MDWDPNNEINFDLTPNYDQSYSHVQLQGPELSPGDSGFSRERNISSSESDQASYHWSSDGNYSYEPNLSTLNYEYNQISSVSTSYSHDPSLSTVSTINSPETIVSPQNSLEITSTPSLFLSHHFKSATSPSTETESFSLSASDDRYAIFRDNQHRRDTEILQLFESSIFNNLVEDNFIKISLQDEALAIGSGLRQLELNKYHEMAQAADLLHHNPNPIINQDVAVDRLQMLIIHKHTEILIKTLKRITSFSSLCIDDQISLLKSRFIDSCIIKTLIFIEPETRTVKINGERISMERCHMMNDENFIKLASSMNPILRSDPIINLLTLLIYLLNPNMGLKLTYDVRKEYILTIHLVQKYLELRGFTINQANYEIKNLICNLENFLILFNAKQKVQKIARQHLGYTSQLIAEMLDINGQPD